MDRGLAPAEFLGATPRERIGKCREMAAEAARQALEATGAERTAYLNLARQWTSLADAMETLPASPTQDD